MTDPQHGFLKNRSYVTQLLSFLNDMGLYLEKDIDNVDHKNLLAKLTSQTLVKLKGMQVSRAGWYSPMCT